jgi:hypothetical protein
MITRRGHKCTNNSYQLTGKPDKIIPLGFGTVILSENSKAYFVPYTAAHSYNNWRLE